MKRISTSVILGFALALAMVSCGDVLGGGVYATASAEPLIARKVVGTDGGGGSSTKDENTGGSSGRGKTTTGEESGSSGRGKTTTGEETGGSSGRGTTETKTENKCSSHHFMGLRAWYDNVDAVCSGKQPKDQYEVRATIWLIVLNLVTMVLQVAGYVCVGFVVWGGYQYMLSRGDAGKVASGKKTITNALIGIALCMTASLISGAVVDITSGAAANDETFVATLFNTAFLWAGIVCAIIMVMGGIAYVTSTGEPQKVTTAKNTIMNAAIGLIITLLAAAIVNLVVNAINNGA